MPSVRSSPPLLHAAYTTLSRIGGVLPAFLPRATSCQNFCFQKSSSCLTSSSISSFVKQLMQIAFDLTAKALATSFLHREHCIVVFLEYDFFRPVFIFELAVLVVVHGEFYCILSMHISSMSRRIIASCCSFLAPNAMARSRYWSGRQSRLSALSWWQRSSY